jgi:hypothetical protein
MLVPVDFRRGFGLARRGVVVCLLLAQGLWGESGGKKAAKQADPAKVAPWVKVSLEGIGFPGHASSFLNVGASMLTVHFIDDSHLLVTFGLRSLVPRLKDDPEGHDDRLVAAEVVELPSGKVAARTEWHMHDHGRYLWALGGGRFLLRIGEQMYTMVPKVGAKEDLAFPRAVFPGRGRKPSLVVVSADGTVLTLETTIVAEAAKTTVVLGDQDSAAGSGPSSKTLIDFFRVGKDMEVTPAGAVQASEPMLLPVDADGYLWAQETGSSVWRMSFEEFGGKEIGLGEVESSCQPLLQMLDRSEFLTMSCHGGTDHIRITSYGLDGKETWEENVGDFGTPTFAFAPEASRFAVSHIVEDSPPPGVPLTDAGATTVSHQEVRVYQNASGDLLLRTECTPVIKTAENFDLSADGTLAAAVRNGEIAIYKLPPLRKEDREDIADVAKFAPPETDAPVRLAKLTVPLPLPLPSVAAKTAVDVTVEKGMVAPAPPVVTGGATVEEKPSARKPPTLLKPGEKPEYGAANGQSAEPQ